MIDLDWITIIIQKKEETSALDEGGFYLGNPFILKIGNQLNEKLEQNKWSSKIFQGISVNAKEFKFSYQLNITGKFFLRETYRKDLEKLIGYLKNNGYFFHFTRIDVCLTTTDDFSEIYKKISLLNTKKLTKVEYSMQGVASYTAIFCSRFTLCSYNKEEQLKKNKDLDYKNKFLEKYKTTKLSRIEIRLKQKDTCSLISNSDDFINVAIHQALLNVEKRLDNSKEIVNLFKTAILNDKTLKHSDLK